VGVVKPASKALQNNTIANWIDRNKAHSAACRRARLQEAMSRTDAHARKERILCGGAGALLSYQCGGGERDQKGRRGGW